MAKLHKWDESAMFFDGSSLGKFSFTMYYYRDLISIVIVAYVFTLAVYITVDIPALRTIVDPVPGVDTREDQVEAMRVLSAGNVIMILSLGAVLILQASPRLVCDSKDFIFVTQQAGQELASRLEAKEVARIAREERESKAKIVDEKKDQ